MSDDPAPREKVWIPTRPEDRLSIAVDRFLKRALAPPCYHTAINDADHGAASDLQRIRDGNRGVKSGQLDLDVWQGPHGLARKVELKRGRNKLTPAQQHTVDALTACGAPPIIAWSLREVHDGLAIAGFRFLDNWQTTLAHMEAQLEAWDREAELKKSGVVVKKRRASKPHVRKAPGLSWIRP